MWHSVNQNFDLSTYLQGLEAESLQTSCSDIKLSEPAKSKSTQGKSYCNDNETESCQSSQSGMTLRHSTELTGEEKLTWYAGDSPARTYPRKATITNKAKVLMESEVDSGAKWHESFAKYDPSMSLWRTHQLSLFGEWEEFLETWPQWGMMRNGECSERVTPPLTTREIEYGFWQNHDGNLSDTQISVENANAAENHIATSATSTTQNAPALGQHRTMLNTPNAEVLQELLPTPVATDWKGGTSAIRKDTGKQRLDQWRDYVKSVYGMTYPHPTHSEMRMDWPAGWTDLKPLETDKFQQWQHLHLLSSNND